MKLPDILKRNCTESSIPFKVYVTGDFHFKFLSILENQVNFVNTVGCPFGACPMLCLNYKIGSDAMKRSSLPGKSQDSLKVQNLFKSNLIPLTNT